MEFLTNNLDTILMVVTCGYELFARLRPSDRNWSIIDNLYSILIQLVPNNTYPSKEEYKEMGIKGVFKIKKDIRKARKLVANQ